MPNGDPDFDKEALDKFFGVIEGAITAFTQRHHLRLEKYYHDSPTWTLSFRHPGGGIASIELLREQDEALGIALSWWYDDFDAATRSIRSRKRCAISPNPELLAAELESAFSDVLSWKFGDWDQRHTGYTTWKKNWSKKQFQDLSKDYPEPVR